MTPEEKTKIALAIGKLREAEQLLQEVYRPVTIPPTFNVGYELVDPMKLVGKRFRGAVTNGKTKLTPE